MDKDGFVETEGVVVDYAKACLLTDLAKRLFKEVGSAHEKASIAPSIIGEDNQVVISLYFGGIKSNHTIEGFTNLMLDEYKACLIEKLAKAVKGE
jgi:hypothetical protein